MTTNAVTWLSDNVPLVDARSYAEAERHQLRLTKPPGSLGTLEIIAAQFCAWQSRPKPQLEAIIVKVFASDHGVCQHQVSAFPQAVTVQMVENFRRGGAAICVLSGHLNADFSIINVGVASALIDERGVQNYPVNAGTQDFTQQAAMTEAECWQAINIGRDQIHASPYSVYIAGEMGIGNTTSASAIYCAVLGLTPEQSVGPGTGVDAEGIARKQHIIRLALEHHAGRLHHALDVLQRVGGYEIAAMVGSMVRAAQLQIPILVDGFIATAAALLAVKLNPQVRQWMLFAHRSAEPAHSVALEYLQAKALLDLGLRLGEGSGAALAVTIIKSALALHNEMATFAAAGVAEGHL